MTGGYENVPTRDIHMNQVQYEQHWLYFLKEYVKPLQELVFTGYYHDVRFICICRIFFLGFSIGVRIRSGTDSRYSHEPSRPRGRLVEISQRLHQSLATTCLYRIRGLRKTLKSWYTEIDLNTDLAMHSGKRTAFGLHTICSRSLVVPLRNGWNWEISASYVELCQQSFI